MLAAAPARPPGDRSQHGSAGAAPGTTASTVQGIDVASFQHTNGATINWSQVAGAGYKFVFIKSTEGAYYTNRYYPGDNAAAEAAGLLVAPYEFAIPNYSGGAFQADYALDHSGYTADGHTLPMIVDLENDPYANLPPPKGDGTSGVCYGLSRAQIVAWISAFAAETHRRTGQRRPSTQPRPGGSLHWRKPRVRSGSALDRQPEQVTRYTFGVAAGRTGNTPRQQKCPVSPARPTSAT